MTYDNIKSQKPGLHSLSGKQIFGENTGGVQIDSPRLFRVKKYSYSRVYKFIIGNKDFSTKIPILTTSKTSKHIVLLLEDAGYATITLRFLLCLRTSSECK